MEKNPVEEMTGYETGINTPVQRSLPVKLETYGSCSGNHIENRLFTEFIRIKQRCLYRGVRNVLVRLQCGLYGIFRFICGIAAADDGNAGRNKSQNDGYLSFHNE